MVGQRIHFFRPDVFPLPLENDLPSNPGRDLPLPPFFFSFRLSCRVAILSARFFCFAAIDATTCSFLSSLAKL